MAGRPFGEAVLPVKDPEAEYDLEGVRRSPLPWALAIVIAVAAAGLVFWQSQRLDDARSTAAAATRQRDEAAKRAGELEQLNRALETKLQELEAQRQRALTLLAAQPRKPPEPAHTRALRKHKKRR